MLANIVELNTEKHACIIAVYLLISFQSSLCLDTLYTMLLCVCLVLKFATSEVPQACALHYRLP